VTTKAASRCRSQNNSQALTRDRFKQAKGIIIQVDCGVHPEVLRSAQQGRGARPLEGVSDGVAEVRGEEPNAALGMQGYYNINARDVDANAGERDPRSVVEKIRHVG